MKPTSLVHLFALASRGGPAVLALDPSAASAPVGAATMQGTVHASPYGGFVAATVRDADGEHRVVARVPDGLEVDQGDEVELDVYQGQGGVLVGWVRGLVELAASEGLPR